MRVVLFLVWKEYLQVFRDRAMVVQIFLMPIVQLLLLANAATFEVRRTPAHVVDLDRSAASRGLVARLAASPSFAVRRVTASPDAADADLRARRAALVVGIPAGFAADLATRRAATVQLAVDAENGPAAGLVQAYASRVLDDHAAALSAVGATAAAAPRLDVRTRGWYNAARDYRQHMVPGILVLLVTLVGTLLTAMNLAREKELGTLEQLNATPLARWQLVAGKLLPFWVLAMVELALGLLVARLAFDVPMRGSVPLVLAAAAVYLVAALGIGLWISTAAETQQQAMFMTFFVVMIYLLMSGLFTPIDGMPAWARAIAEANPIKHFVVIMRAVLVKGAGVEAIGRPFGALVLFAAAFMTLAVRRHAKTAG